MPGAQGIVVLGAIRVLLLLPVPKEVLVGEFAFFFGSGFGSLHIFGKEICGMRPGERVVLDNLRINVLVVDEDGCPIKAAFAFSVSLDDRSLKWLRWDWRTMSYLPFIPPEVGESVIVRGVF